MKTFLAVYLGSPSSASSKRWAAMDTAAQAAKDAEGVKAWIEWGKSNADSIVENGPPLGKTKRVDLTGIRDVTNELTGYALVRAETHEDAAKLFLNHPHFSIFAGAAVEVMECLPMPEMP